MNLPGIPLTPEPPDPRLALTERPPGLTNQQLEQLRFGLGTTGPLTQAVLNNNAGALIQAFPFGITASSGMTILFACKDPWTVPSGWLEISSGTITVAKLTYPSLFDIIGITFGSTDTTFTLPALASINTNLRYIVKI